VSRAAALPAPSPPVETRHVGFLVLSLAVIAGLHAGNLPVWALIFCVLIGGWRYLLFLRHRSDPPKWLRLSLTAAAFLAVLLTYESFLGRDPGVTALVLFSTLKLLELRDFRDYMVVIYLCFFLLFALFLYEQSVFSAMAMAVLVPLLLAQVVHVNLSASGRPRGERGPSPSRGGRFALRFSLKIVLFSLPGVAALFFLFPRPSGPLWDLPQGGMGWGRSGFSEFVRPGSIAWVAQSNETAFRVVFPNDDMPAHSDLYFRGLVLWFTDGRYWMQGIFPFRSQGDRPSTAGALTQDIMLEPHHRNWLFALDRPVSFPAWAGRLPGSVFQTRDAVKRPLRYRAHSRLPGDIADDLHPMVRKWSLQLPRRLNPRLLRLAATFRRGAADTDAVVAAGLDHFCRSGFEYTLNPGFLDREDPIGDFVFRSRQGFCEHFAAAFAVLMRAAGVPTRVVVGYQGGKFNPVGRYLNVRQADAHAWTEVWLPGRGWRRMDPTAVVSPERVQYGIDVSRSLATMGEVSEAERSAAIRGAMRRGLLKRIWETLKDFWDSLNSNWNYWVISYDANQQQDMMAKLGVEEGGWLTMVLILGFTLAVLAAAASIFLARRNRVSDPVLAAYHRFCLKAGAAGTGRMPWEGPLDFLHRLTRRFPGRAREIRALLADFIALRYGGREDDDALLRRFRRRVRGLRL